MHRACCGASDSMHFVRTDNLQPRYKICIFIVQPPAEADEIAEREDRGCEEVGRDDRADVRPNGGLTWQRLAALGAGSRPCVATTAIVVAMPPTLSGSSTYFRSIDLG